MVLSNKLQQLLDTKLRRLPEWESLNWIHIQNITDYYLTSEQSFWELRTDFPNVAPPWPSFVTYYHHPGRWRSDGKWIDWPGDIADVLTLCRAISLPPTVPKAKWILSFRIFNLGRVNAEMRIFLPVAADGTCPGLPARQIIEFVPRDKDWIPEDSYLPESML